jgi:anti-anti-sigma regulatory factor
MSLSITLTIRSGGVVVLAARGAMLRTNIDALCNAVTGVIRAHRPHEIELEFSGVLDMDLGAAAVVTAVMGEAARAGAVPAIVHASPSADRQIRLAGGEHLLR